ncbi:MAG: ATP-binding cassette domain-containing protein [Ignavibacteria bacterium]|nr:ATP-binding cassette domain-containing protein [Ignavibacteria bacterium]
MILPEIKHILELRNISYTPPKVDLKQKENTDSLILNNISFGIEHGEIFGITGESGSGKTTLGRIICGLINQTSGEKVFFGEKFYGIHPDRSIQFLFQNYSASHDPSQKNRDALKEVFALKQPNSNFDEFAKRLLHKVKLNENVLELFPYELSGGQQQRLALAKILALNPKLIILDEPFASQDVTAQHELIDLLLDLNRTEKLTIICISHDLFILRKLCSRIMIMNHGQIVEILRSDELFTNPKRDYTKLLVRSFV